MSTLTKCCNDGCEKRNQCWRWQAPEEDNQKYCMFEPKAWGCTFFINTEGE